MVHAVAAIQRQRGRVRGIDGEGKFFRIVHGGHNWALWRGNAADAYLAASKHLGGLDGT